MNALIRYHLKLDPDSLITKGDNEELNFDKYFRVWGELEWCLEREMTVNIKPQD